MSSSYNTEETSSDRNVEIWKIKKLIKSLEMDRGLVQHIAVEYYVNHIILII